MLRTVVAVLCVVTGLTIAGPRADAGVPAGTLPLDIPGHITDIARVPGDDSKWALIVGEQKAKLQLARFDPGEGWTLVHTPYVKATFGYSDIAMAGPDNGWAVAMGAETDGYLIHWDGEEWSRVHPPAMRLFKDQCWLWNVSAPRPGNVWVTGMCDSDFGMRVWHRDTNGIWHQTLTDDQRQQLSMIYDVIGVGDDGAWMAADPMSGATTQLMRWNGSSWTQTRAPEVVVEQLSASSPDDVWAATAYSSAPTPLHWTGSKWVEERLPDDVSADDLAIDATAYGGAVYVATRRGASSGPYMAVHDGTGWSRVAVPDGCAGSDQNNLTDVEASTTRTYVVGYCGDPFDGPRRTLAWECINGQWTRI